MNRPLFPRTQLHTYIAVEALVSLHYFEFSKDYVFEGEKHDFWEFLYVDKGEVDVFADRKEYRLRQGDIIFHQPNEFHSVWANRKIAPNLIVISFECGNPGIQSFAGKIFTLNASQRELLSLAMAGGMAAFRPPFDNPRCHILHRREDAPPEAEQRLRLYLELLLLDLHHSGKLPQSERKLANPANDRSEKELAARIQDYLDQRLHEKVSVEEICACFNISKSQAHTVFRKRTGQSLMRYYNSAKIERAKQMIRESRHTYTEIADGLRYSSVHNFSRQFKSLTGMSPSEYARSVKAML